jgi:excinuclease ABC subunit A
VTGVSGSGKSTLVSDVLYQALARALNGSRERPGAHDTIEGIEAIDKVIDIDQSPIGRTPRSNPATYTGLFGTIRELFAATPESRVRGYMPGRFSFNVKGGRCEHCKGDGILKIEMQFLPDVYVPCEVCKGKRYNREALEIHYKGRTIADVLEMTIEEALDFFSAVPAVRAKLATLNDVGLGYVHLGQPATTLSGGEAQRVKLATELSRRATGRTLYVLDEPTTGLHMADVEKLLHVLHRLVDAGNTVVVIEHNLDVVKTADWIIDLGPEGGERGGYVIGEGTPEEIAAMSGSATGEYLARVLRGEPLVPLSAVTFAESAPGVAPRTRPAAPVRIEPAPQKRAAASSSRRAAD